MKNSPFSRIPYLHPARQYSAFASLYVRNAFPIEPLFKSPNSPNVPYHNVPTLIRSIFKNPPSIPLDQRSYNYIGCFDPFNIANSYTKKLAIRMLVEENRFGILAPATIPLRLIYKQTQSRYLRSILQKCFPSGIKHRYAHVGLMSNLLTVYNIDPEVPDTTEESLLKYRHSLGIKHNSIDPTFRRHTYCISIVRLVNGTPNPDGSFSIYWLRIPPPSTQPMASYIIDYLHNVTRGTLSYSSRT